jgi:hypothetical protein
LIVHRLRAAQSEFWRATPHPTLSSTTWVCLPKKKRKARRSWPPCGNRPHKRRQSGVGATRLGTTPVTTAGGIKFDVQQSEITVTDQSRRWRPHRPGTTCHARTVTASAEFRSPATANPVIIDPSTQREACAAFGSRSAKPPRSENIRRQHRHTRRYWQSTALLAFALVR